MSFTDAGRLGTPRHAYIVDEPDEITEGASERSTSVDGSEQFRFSMADMEVYLHVLQTDRCVVHLATGQLEVGGR